MDLNEFYTISFKDYKANINNSKSLFTILTDNSFKDLSIRIYHNKKLLYRFLIYDNCNILGVERGNGDYVKFNLINIKKELLENSLKLLDSDDSLNHKLFLEILKLKLDEST